MAKANIYLTFNGNCEAAFLFYQSVFGGEFVFKGRFGDMPSMGSSLPVPDEDIQRIMHISLPIGGGTMLLGSDTGVAYAKDFVHGNNFSISVHTDSKAEADELFNKLSDGGYVTMPLETTFWGSYYGMCTDKFGINWMLNYDVNNQNNS